MVGRIRIGPVLHVRAEPASSGEQLDVRRTYKSTKRRSGNRLQRKRSCSGAGDLALIDWDDDVGPTTNGWRKPKPFWSETNGE